MNKIEESLIAFPLSRIKIFRTGPLPETRLTNSELAAKVLQPYYENETIETALCLAIDAGGFPVHIFTVGEGDEGRTSVNVKKLLQGILASGADQCVLAHNHVYGTCEPSKADRAMTEKVGAACTLIGVSFQDHLIYGPDGWYSIRLDARTVLT